ncbi:MAG: hypothetical protein K2X39_09270 [Silvanigrellaceae bacterium]|nr:hypothetical protein [Silvanigrellaceae bacterium]
MKLKRFFLLCLTIFFLTCSAVFAQLAQEIPANAIHSQASPTAHEKETAGSLPTWLRAAIESGETLTITTINCVNKKDEGLFFIGFDPNLELPL